MRKRLGVSFVVVLLVSVVGEGDIGFSQEHFLLETALEENEDIPENKGELDARHRTVLGLTLWTHTLEEAQKKLGKAQVIEPGHHFDPFVCYRSARPGDDTVLTLSFLEHGEPRYLTRFQIIGGNEKFKARGKCTKSPLASQQLSTQSGLRLGQTPEEVKKLWGAPVKVKPNHLLMSFDTYKEKTVEGKTHCSDVFSWTAARFVESTLTWLEVLEGGEFIREGHCTGEELRGRKN